MGKMLHNEARELLVESYEKTHNAEEIAKIFGVNKLLSTIWRSASGKPAAWQKAAAERRGQTTHITPQA